MTNETVVPLRRSSRIRTATTSVQDNAISATKDSVSPSRPRTASRKRVKKSHATTQDRNTAGTVTQTGRRNYRKKTLSILMNMPLDILFEIFGHLSPPDVLHLARTTKVLRRVLMHRSATTVWKNARQNIPNLPDIPSDLTEPQYANLIFDPFCHFCRTARVQTAIWACRVRCCKKCFGEQFVELIDVFMAVPRNIRPAIMIPSIERSGKLKFLRLHLTELVEAVASVSDDQEKLAKLEVDRTEKVKLMESTGDLLEEWQDDQDTMRAVELENLRLHRRLQITTKLSEHGYAGEIPKMEREDLEEFINQPWMKQPKELTDRIWVNIKHTVLEYMAEVRARRVVKENRCRLAMRMLHLQPAIYKFKRTQNLSEYSPLLSDFCSMPEILAILQSTANLDEDSLNPLLEQLPQMCQRWHQSASQVLAKALPKSVNGAQPDIFKLNLATAWFNHEDCSSFAVTYPRILYHDCLSHVDIDNPGPSVYPPTDFLITSLAAFQQLPWAWRVNRLEFDHGTADVIRIIIGLCGLDPDVTTAQEMDDLDARFFCISCSLAHEDACAMGWRTLVTHIHDDCHHEHVQEEMWAMLNEADTKFVKDGQSKVMEDQLKPFAIWSCSHYRNAKDLWNGIRNHLHLTHDKVSPEEGRDYHISLDSCVTRQHPPPYECPYDMLQPYLSTLGLPVNNYNTVDDATAT